MAFKRLLLGLFICLCSFLLMSHNSFASEVVWKDVSLYRAIDTPSTRCPNGWSNNLCSVVTNNQPSGVNYIYWQDSFDNLTYGEYWFEVYVSFSDFGTGQAPLIVTTPSSINGATVSWEQVSSTTRGSSTTRIYRYLGHWQGNLDIQPYNVGLYSSANWVNTGAYSINYVAWYKKNVNSDATNQQIVNAINSQSSYLNSISSKLDTIADSYNQALEKEKNATQDAADNASSSGSSAAESSQNATSSLLSTITGFFNAIIGVNPSNCKFNSNLPFLPGNGEIDLCSISTPPIVQTLSSLVLVGLFIPFCIHMFNRFVSITESFQR